MGSQNQIRELIHDLSAAKLTKAKDGSLTIPGVTLLAAGTWTDSNFGTPLTYPEETLKEYAANWFDNPLWSRHGGGSPRSITDKIGEITNPRYNAAAVIGDLILHGKTQTSRDTIELITSGLVNAVSVEHSGRERWDEDTRTYQAEELIFYGAAIVNKGACSVCTINNEASRSSAEANDTMELKELETKLADAEGKIKELSDASATKEQLSELEAKITELESATEKIKELETKLEEIEKSDKITELEGRVTKIEKTPFPPATHGSPIDNDLGTVDLSGIINDTEGITRRIF
jgi:hypothetical protein